MATDDVDPDAPHGRDTDGTPLAPYGYLVSGQPRKSNRGARPGQRANGNARGKTKARNPGAPASSATNKRRKETLVGLAEMLVVTPLAGLSASPQIAKRIGESHTDALAGDAVIVAHFMPSVADGLIMLSESKPGVLSWLDTVEDKAPYLMLAQVGLQVAKALVENHAAPNPSLAAAGRTMVQIRLAQMAAQIEEEARAMGIPTEVPNPAEDAA